MNKVKKAVIELAHSVHEETMSDPNIPAEIKAASRCAIAAMDIFGKAKQVVINLKNDPKPEDTERLTQDAEILEAILEQLKGAFPEEADGEADPSCEASQA